MVTEVTKLDAKSCSKFFCEKCDYRTSKKSSFDKHLGTDKHCSVTTGDDKVSKNCENLICKTCSKIYNSRNGLWKHKKTCKQENNEDEDDKETTTEKELIMLLIKENSEFKNMMMEVIKNGIGNNNHNTTINSHNKTFNLQLFLNETCKDAMNINEFVDSIKLQLSDLENVGEVGFVKGISNIIIKNLKALDVGKRPVHCTDSKRETLYIKDENKWEKEDEDKLKLKKAIKRIANKNISLIQEFKAKYPDCIYSESKRSDQYNKLIIEAFELSNPEKQDKIVKNITKEVVIDKKKI